MCSCRKNVCTSVRQRNRNVLKKAHTVRCLNDNLYPKLSSAAGIPRNRNDTLWIVEQVFNVRAIGAVNRNAATACNEAHNIVTCNRIAAMCKMNKQIWIAIYHNAAVRLLGATTLSGTRNNVRANQWLIVCNCLVLLLKSCGIALLLSNNLGVFLLQDFAHAINNLLSRLITCTNSRKQVIYAAIIKLLGKLVKRLDGTRGTDAITALTQLFCKLRTAALSIVRLVLLREILTDLCTRRRSLYQRHPVARRTSVLVSQNLNAVAHLKRMRQRNNRSVNTRTDTVITHLSVDGISKVQRC